MSENVIQTSFSAGELSPNLLARVDFAKYRSGCATLRNFFVDYRSGASTRPGTEFIRPASTNTSRVRLIRFQQSVSVTYVIEFGEHYLRFISQGSSVVEGAHGITAVTNTTSTAVTSPGNGFGNGEMVFITGVAGMPQINNRYYIVTGAGTTFNLRDSLTNVEIDSSAWGTYAGGGTAQRVYTISSPYAASELAQLKFSQNASIMNITHPNHKPYVLTLISATNWTLVQATIGATVDPPVMQFVDSSAPAGTVYYKYGVTSVDSNNQESGISGTIILNHTSDLRTVAGTNRLGWFSASNADFYNIYGTPPLYYAPNSDPSSLGFMGSLSGDSDNIFYDSNIAPDFAQTPPIPTNPFADVNPAVSSYFQQRLVYANGGGEFVDTFWASKTGAPYNFDVSNPPQANDAITGSLVSLEVNEIKSLIPMPTGLLALTTNGSWLISGGSGGVASQGGPLTPISATATPQSYIGANDVPPIVVNYDIVFVQAKGSIVRDMTYNIYANIYTGNDISILSSHLFYNHQIIEWAYAEEPFKSIWVVREDGIMLNLTLVKEQDMYGWSRHDTRGNFESICAITEGTVDAVYVAVRRPNPIHADQSVLQIERLADRVFPFGAEDAFSVDAGLKTISNFPNMGLQVILSGDEALLATDTAFFSSSQIGWIVRVGGGILETTEFLQASRMKAKVLQPITDLIPDDPLNRPKFSEPGSWSFDKPFTTVFGLDHLEGQVVSVLADGGVVNDLQVVGGSITLPQPATKVIAGYAFQAQLQTMPLDLGSEVNSIQGKRKKVGALTVRVKDSRGLKAGNTFDTITPLKELNRVTLMGLPVKLITDDERIVMDPLWNVPGQICLQVDDPLPATILGVIPEVVVGDSGGK
jgi:hypothetical protein